MKYPQSQRIEYICKHCNFPKKWQLNFKQPQSNFFHKSQISKYTQ